MKIDGKPTRTIWLESDGATVGIIDQTLLPHRFVTARLSTLDEAAHAIKSMQVRGAPLIGAAAAYGFWLGATGRLAGNPVKEFEHLLGLWALRFLIATLSVTPMSIWLTCPTIIGSASVSVGRISWR